MDRFDAPGPEQGPAPASEQAVPPSALDTLFGESNFQEYDDAPAVASPAAPRRRAGSADASSSTTQKVMIGVVGGLVALLALTALFFLGTRLPAILPKPAAVVTTPPTPTPTPTPTSTATPVGPVAAGVHPWEALLGGECLDPFTGPWAETFTVVDCAAAHPAQLVFRGTFDPTTTPTFPGPDALQQQIALLCAAPGVLDLAVAGQYSDAQVQGAYPVTQAEWDAGQHDYFCFVSRSSGQAMTGSLAAAK